VGGLIVPTLGYGLIAGVLGILFCSPVAAIRSGSLGASVGGDHQRCLDGLRPMASGRAALGDRSRWDGLGGLAAAFATVLVYATVASLIAAGSFARRDVTG
jgi:hypothetical protein